MAAQAVIDEITDQLEVLDSKLDRLTKNIARLEDCKNAAEKKKINDSALRDIEKINNDIRGLQYDLKRLPKDKEAEYVEQISTSKSKLAKLEKRLQRQSPKKTKEEIADLESQPSLKPKPNPKFDTVKNDLEEIELQEASGLRSQRSNKFKEPVISGRKRKQSTESAKRVASYQADIQNSEEAHLREEKIDMNKASAEVVGSAALRIQDKSKQAVERMIKKLGAAEELAQEELMELQKQNEKIMKIDTTLNQIEATSQRTMKYVRYFGKTMMTDKFMICMIMMILIVIVVLIVVAILKKRE
ncbi:hypothetical protein FGO68_gene6080 [Halteria grandinella]|uniref:t-SNARE coiled-coil homology domain-containing protein n=1 Tax=Halteria grandinella TaxID=5974 RepID=A0A8J8T5D7_HALGN|nr:hypothetical protein FGO68_gene6080 [Halteria grandinella]